MSDIWELRDPAEPCAKDDPCSECSVGLDTFCKGRKIIFKEYVVHDKCEYCPTLWMEERHRPLDGLRVYGVGGGR